MNRSALRRLAAPLAVLCGLSSVVGLASPPVHAKDVVPTFHRVDVDAVQGAAFTAIGEVYPGERNIITAGYGTLTGGVPSGGGTLQVYRPGENLLHWEKVAVFGSDTGIVFPNMPTVTDVDGDGLNDLMVPSGYFFDTNPANPGGAQMRSGITWWENRGLGGDGEPLGFTRHDVLNGRGPAYHGVDVIDLDGDGIRDIVTTAEAGMVADNQYDDTVRLEYLRGTGGGSFAAPVTLADGYGGSQPVVSDVDGDGRLDIVSAQYFGLNYTEGERASFMWFRQSGDATAGLTSANFTKNVIATFRQAGFGFQIRPVVGFREPGKISWIGTNHQGRCFLQRVVIPGLEMIGMEGINVPEMVMEFVPGSDLTKPWAVKNLSVPENTVDKPEACDAAFNVRDSTVPIHPTDYITARSAGGQAGPGVFGYGDLDGDGDMDLAVSGDGDRRVFWIEQRPGQTRDTVLHTLSAPGEEFGQAGGAAIDDLDGDGRAEVVFSSFDKSTVALWTTRTVRDPVKEEFTSSGTFTVPGGVTSVRVSAVGGAGGDADNGSATGGRGALVEATLGVTPGTALQIHVAGPGASSGATTGGANGGGDSADARSGSGGGASDVRMGGNALSDRILVAAGGGGAAYVAGGSLAGGDAHRPGRTSICEGAAVASPGTSTAGGTGSRGAADCPGWTAGNDGGTGVGGAGLESGGGGGGGWYGGGAGGSNASGAGGSSYVAATVSSDASITLARAGAQPKVVVSFDKLASGMGFASGTPTSGVVGTTFDLVTTSGDSSAPVTLSLGLGTTNAACTLSGTTLTLAQSGRCDVVASQVESGVYYESAQTHTIAVVGAPTSTTLDVEATRLSASVQASGSPVVSGSVRFLLGAELQATVPLTNGSATWEQAAPGANDATAVTAEFTGTSLLAPSLDTTDRISAEQPTFAGSTPASALVGTSLAVSTAPSIAGASVDLTVAGLDEVQTCRLEGTSVFFEHVGRCDLKAAQAGDWLRLPSVATRSIHSESVGTSTTVSVRPTTVAVTVKAESPSTLKPTGQVRVVVDTKAVATVTLVNGVAEVPYKVPAGGDRAVTAEYLGSSDAGASSGSVRRSDPRITAAVSSSVGPRSGWYRTPVKVSFTCVAKGAPLTCPAPRVLSANGANHTVRATVTAADGGSATAVVAGISIDSVAPSVKVSGVKKGKTVKAKKRPKVRCVGSDTLSGLARCSLTQRVTKKAGKKSVISYTAVATDRAGNTAKVTGRYTWVKK